MMRDLVWVEQSNRFPARFFLLFHGNPESINSTTMSVGYNDEK